MFIKNCAVGESNPGPSRGRRRLYHLTNRALDNDTWYPFLWLLGTISISQKGRDYVIVVITMNDSRCGSTFIFAMIYLKGVYLWILKMSIWFRQVIVIWSRWFSHTRVHCSHFIRTCDLPCTLLYCFKVNVYFRRLVKARRALIC